MILLGVGVALMLYGLSGSSLGRGYPLNSKRIYNLPDVDPADQSGNYKKDYDIYFASAADDFGVPFALLKAHALMESSLNPRAFRDENPSKRTDRLGWASRGLMQLLFWPNSTRFEKYGFKSSRNPDDLYDPNINVRIAAQLIRDNLNACGGNLRDSINMYNTGVKESVREAPHNYVDRVLAFYETILGRKVY